MIQCYFNLKNYKDFTKEKKSRIPSVTRFVSHFNWMDSIFRTRKGLAFTVTSNNRRLQELKTDYKSCPTL